MKRALSLATAVILLISIICSCQIFVFAEPDDSKALYTVTEEVYADAYMLVDLADAENPIIAQKNPSAKKFPASLTKIAVAMVIINNANSLEDEATVSQKAIDLLKDTGAQTAGLKVGDSITVDKLLQLILVYSACDASNVAAEYIAGSIDSFVGMMNDWAKSVGCTGTNFVNCTGLHDDNHYSTANDLMLMTLAALKNPVFCDYSANKSVTYGGNTFLHTNLMLNSKSSAYYYEYASGIKTGTTKEAGNCVITKADKGDYSYLAIVLDSPAKKINGSTLKGSFVDAKTLFEWAFNNLEKSAVLRQDGVVAEIPVKKGKGADSVGIGPSEDIYALLPSSYDTEAVKTEPVGAPELMVAPITKGDRVCTANISYNGKIIKTVDLVALQSIEKPLILKILDAIGAFFKNKIVKAVIITAVLLFVLWFIIRVIRVRQAKKRAAERRRRLQQQRRRRQQAARQANAVRRPPPDDM